MRLRQAVAIAMFTVCPGAGQAAQQCDARAFAMQIDQAAQELRNLNRESERRFHERLAALGKQQAWTEAQKADKAAAAMDDSKLESFNSEIEDLIAKLDSLSATPNSEVSCARLGELKAVKEKLVAIMAQKSGFILAQLEAEGSKAPVSPYVQVPAKQAQSAQPQPGETVEQPSTPWSVNIAKTVQPAPKPAAPMPQKPALPAQVDTRTASLNPPSKNPAAAPEPQTAGRYTVQEIRDAGKGVFGSLTSEFAILVNHSFKQFGQPNAYIVGDEGGGAFLAGLRYGDGKLYSRLNGVDAGPTPIYWQGPSIGADLGATGSHTLFLVYNLTDPAALYRRFPGIDGSAYVAGGLGLTVYRSGDTLIVPIRTGLGLRLGASIAYLKFTERASLNPF